MFAMFVKLERRARFLMCFVAVLLGLVAIAANTGLIRATPAYDANAWYAESNHSGLVVISEFADEAECLRNVAIPSRCRSGKTINDSVPASIDDRKS